MTKRRAVLTLLFCLLATVGVLLFAFMPPNAQWDTTSSTRIIAVGYGGERDYNYIDPVQIWGDGRIIWVKYDPAGKRQVLEGHVSQSALKQLIDQLNSMGFFNGYRFPSLEVVMGEYLEVDLLSAHHRVKIDKYDAINQMIDFLKSGAGAEGKDFAPTSGWLLAYPVAEVGLPSSTSAKYTWPDAEFGYNLQAVYSHQPHNQRLIAGQELRNAWDIVNSRTPLVESDGKVYWIAVMVPDVSP